MHVFLSDTASLWKFSGLAHHHSRLAGFCAEQAAGSFNKNAATDMRNAWPRFVEETGSTRMHWLGFRLGMAVLGWDYEQTTELCYDRNRWRDEEPPRYTDGSEGESHTKWENGNSQADTFGADSMCDAQRAVCPQMASGSLLYRIRAVHSLVIEHAARAEATNNSTPGANPVDCWVHVENLFDDLAHCFHLYTTAQHAGSAFDLDYVREELRQIQEEGRPGANHANANPDTAGCKSFFPNEELRNAMYSREASIACAIGFAGCCAGVNATWTARVRAASLHYASSAHSYGRTVQHTETHKAVDADRWYSETLFKRPPAMRMLLPKN